MLVVILFLVVVLVAVVTGCGGAPQYDGRLTAADSLMRGNPDSALALIEAIPATDLAAVGDQAYRDLLLTQARYRCYVTATSDSDINRALEYYRAHSGEREKLTRAYLYKGAVMEELGHPDSAMLYYKHAEATAAHDDYFVLGQINTRIGDLYRMYYADKQICYDKYKKALECYTFIDDKKLQLNCLFNMGICSGITGNDDSRYLLDSAARMAMELNDSYIYYASQEMMARQLCMNDSTRSESKEIALHLLHHFAGSAFLTSDLLLDLAFIYNKEGLLDSAKYYARIVETQPDNSTIIRVRIRTLNLLAEIAQFEGDTIKCYQYLDISKSLSDSISNNEQKYRIQFIEDQGNEENAKNLEKKRNKQLGVIWTIGIILVVIMLFFTFHQYREMRIVKMILNDLKRENLDKHEAFLGTLHAKETTIETLVNNMVSFIQTAIDTAEHDPLSIIRKRINETIRNIANDDFWIELRSYLDRNHNNIISNLANNKRINESDIKFLELECCGFSYIEMAITLGYSPKYVFNKRKKIEKKLGLESSLQEFIANAMNE